MTAMPSPAASRATAISPEPGTVIRPAAERPVNELLDDALALATSTGPIREEEMADLLLTLLDRADQTLPALRQLVASQYFQARSNFWLGGDTAAESLLIGLLTSLDHPGAELLAADWLRSGPSPDGVVALAVYLEAVSDDRYADDIRLAAESILRSAEFAEQVPGPLFEVLARVGNEQTIALLANLPMHRDAYASVALALIPNGDGLLLVAEDAVLYLQGTPNLNSRLAVELLAQQAYRNEFAAGVLMDLAERRLVPSDLWDDVLALVAGEHEIVLRPPARGWAHAHTIFRPEGNQTLYRTARPAGLDSIDDLLRRIQLLEQLAMWAP